MNRCVQVHEYLIVCLDSLLLPMFVTWTAQFSERLLTLVLALIHALNPFCECILPVLFIVQFIVLKMYYIVCSNHLSFKLSIIAVICALSRGAQKTLVGHANILPLLTRVV